MCSFRISTTLDKKTFRLINVVSLIFEKLSPMEISPEELERRSGGVLCQCYGLNTCDLPKCVCWNPIPWGDGIKRWAFERWLGHKGRTLTNGISALRKEASWSSHAQRVIWGHSEKSIIQKSALPSPCWYPDVKLLASRTMKNKFMLFITYPVCCVLHRFK